MGRTCEQAAGQGEWLRQSPSDGTEVAQPGPVRACSECREGNPMSTDVAPAGRESSAAARLQILAAEHWSLLATRSLTYNEALSRVTIFLAILSGAVIAL